jgi:hypothetical protein
MELQQVITLAFQLSILAAAFGCGLGATTTDARELSTVSTHETDWEG